VPMQEHPWFQEINITQNKLKFAFVDSIRANLCCRKHKKFVVKDIATKTLLQKRLCCGNHTL